MRKQKHNDNSLEFLRNLKIKFYNIKKLNPKFDFSFANSLNIYDLIIEQNHADFSLYYKDDSLNLLSFDCDGFDIE